MRARLFLLVLAILGVAGFAALNWAEFSRTSLMSFGILTMELPLGLVLLCLMAFGLLVYLAGAISMATRHLVESRHNAKALEAQRDLADKAEASRFTELRQYLDAQLRDTRQREALAGTEVERSLALGRREVQEQLQRLDGMLMARLAEIDNRLDIRTGRPDLQGGLLVTPQG